MDVTRWLHDLGFIGYAALFREQAIDAAVLPSLTDADLEKLGLPLGHRKKLLAAIAALGTGPSLAAQARPAPQAERRQLSVMFADLVGSTEISARLDPEDLRELIGAYHRCIARGVERHGGFVAKYMGDGVLAYFGYPRAREDDAERAVRASLDLVTAVRALDVSAEAPLRLRIGIATGLVVVGDLIGRGAAQEQAVVGGTPNLAARLQALAEPDSVVIAADTRRLVGDFFECLDLGAVPAKGFAEPVRAFRVLGAGAAESRFEALHATLTPMVGRDTEIDLVLRRWRQAADGGGGVVLVSSEPGVGKSRLLAAVQERLANEPHTALRYFCSPNRQDSALHPVIAQLERAAGFARGDAPEMRLAKLESLLAPASPAPGDGAREGRAREDMALLAELLSLPPGERYALAPLAPQLKRERTFAALLRQLERLAGAQPVLMVFEDVHWIDPSSRQLLDLAVACAARLPALLLVTCRPEFEPPWLGQPQVTALSLNRLDPRQAAVLVRRVVGGVAGGVALAEALVAEIVERTDGVPLFVEELTKAVLEAGAAPVGAAQPAALAVPGSLHASLMARLDRLEPAAREVAQDGAVIGREFSHELLAAVAGFEEGALAAALDQLTGAGLVFRRGAGAEAGYLFKHALVRDAAYGTLLRGRRRQLHAGVARALEQRFPEQAGTAPELVAHHLTEAGEAHGAVRYWLEAGRRSAARSADREAVRHLQRGLEVLAGLPASAERDRLELDFQLAIGTPLIALSGWSGPEVAVAYERAGVLCESLGDDEHLVPTLFGLASNRVVRGQTRVAQRLAERCCALAEHRDSPADRLLAHRAMGAALLQLGSLQEARAQFERIGALYDPQRDRSLAARCVTDPHASGLSFLSLVLWIMGYPDAARRTAGKASRCAAELGHANTTGHILCHAGGELAQFLHDVPATRGHGEAALALADEHAMPMWRGYGLVLRGWAVAEEESAERGVTLVRQGIKELDAIGTVFHRPHHLGILAAMHARLGDPAAGLDILEEAYAEMARTEVRLFEAELRRIEGELRLLAGEGDSEAEACFVAALAVARRQKARSFELRAATSLARLLRRQGRRDEARDGLSAVLDWFTEGFDTPDLQEARAMRDGLR